VITGAFPMGLSEWRYTLDRNKILDFSSCASHQFVLAVTPQVPAIDPQLFIRFKGNIVLN